MASLAAHYDLTMARTFAKARACPRIRGRSSDESMPSACSHIQYVDVRLVNFALGSCESSTSTASMITGERGNKQHRWLNLPSIFLVVSEEVSGASPPTFHVQPQLPAVGFWVLCEVRLLFLGKNETQASTWLDSMSTDCQIPERSCTLVSSYSVQPI